MNQHIDQKKISLKKQKEIKENHKIQIKDKSNIGK